MPIADGTYILLALFALYLGFRLESLNQIWSELEKYEDKIQGEYLKFLSDNYVSPFVDSMGPDVNIDEVTDNIPLTTDELSELNEIHTDLVEDGVSKDRRIEIIDQLVSEELGDDRLQIPSGLLGLIDGSNHLPQIVALTIENLPSKEEIDDIPDNIESVMDNTGDGGEGPRDFAEVTDSMFIYYIYSEDILDPNRLFEKTRSFYRKYRWPNRLFTFIQSVILGIILSILTIGLFTVTSTSIPDTVLPVIGVMTVLWFVLELALWYLVSTEVEMDNRTFIGKLLKPDPREFI